MLLAGHRTTNWTLGTRTGDAFEDALLGVAEAGIACYRRVYALAAATGWLFRIRTDIEWRWWVHLKGRMNLAEHIWLAMRMREQMDLARDLNRPAMKIAGSKLAAVVALSTKAALTRLLLQRRLAESYEKNREAWEAAGIRKGDPVTVETVVDEETRQFATVIKGTSIVI